MRGKSLAGPALATYLVIALCGVVPVWLHYSTAAGGDAPSQPFVLAVILMSGLRFSLLMGHQSRRPYEMVFWVFVYVFLGLAPYAQLRLEIIPSTTPIIDLSLVNTAAVVVLAGCLAVSIGSWVSRKSPAVKSSRRLVSGRVFLLSIAALVAAGYYVAKIGASNLFLSRTDLNGLKSDIWGDSTTMTIVTATTQMSLLVAFVALSRLKAEGRLRGLSAVLLRALVFVVLIVVSNPISTPRYIFGTVMLAVVITWGAYATIWRYRITGVATVVGIVTIFPLADLFRVNSDAELKISSPIESMTGGDFDSFAQIVNSVSFVADRGIEWGSQFLGVLFFWVPSRIWTGKPGDTGALLAEFQGYRYKNLSAPLWAELFVNGGWVLLIAGMVLAGFWLRRLDRGVERSLRTVKIPGIVASILPFYLLILLRGSLLSAVAYLAVVLVCAWAVTGRASSAQGARAHSVPSRAQSGR